MNMVLISRMIAFNKHKICANVVRVEQRQTYIGYGNKWPPIGPFEAMMQDHTRTQNYRKYTVCRLPVRAAVQT